MKKLRIIKFILVIGLMISSVPFNSIIVFAEESEISNQIALSYDDHLDMTGKTVEIIDAGIPTSYQVGYGVVEGTKDTAVVMMKDNTLIATGIGEASISIDGTMYEVNVQAAPISLMLLAGQSNMQGMDGDANQSIACEDGQVYATFGERFVLNASNATNFAASSLAGEYRDINVNGNDENLSDFPIYSLQESGAGKYGMDSAIAYEWNKQTGEKVWTINTGHGGSNINSWLPGGDNYNETKALLGACLDTLQKEIAAGHYTLSHMGYFWCQGCADETQTAKWYADKYIQMHEEFKRLFSFDHDNDTSTPNRTFEFGGIIPIRSGHQGAGSYRAGVYKDKTSASYFTSFYDLRMNGPRVAQYWMGNNPELTDIFNVCTIQEEWATMPDGSDGVKEYFEKHYLNGKVDYPVQKTQSSSWYKPTTPAHVHDNIHYNQVGYNEIGRESVRNTLVYLGINEPQENSATVKFVGWDGFTPINEIIASPNGSSATLVVPMVSPVYLSKQVTYDVSNGLTYNYYDVLAENIETTGTLSATTQQNVSIVSRNLTSYRWTFDGSNLVSDTSYGDESNVLAKQAGSISNQMFNKVRYQAEQPLVLKHDEKWVVEWSMQLDATATGSMMLSTDSSSNSGEPYIYIRGTNSFVGIGNHDGSNYYHVGYYMNDFGIKMNEMHTYRLVNRVNELGNMIYLFVDGKEIGPLNQRYQGSTTYIGESDYISGKDFSFSSLGTTEHPLIGMKINYLVVSETGTDENVHFHNYLDWYESSVPSKEEPGIFIRKCSGCDATQEKTVDGVWQKMDFEAHVSDIKGDYCRQRNIWQEAQHDKYYLVENGTWGVHNSNQVYSITIPVKEGDHVYATSFGKAGTNGSATSNGIRMTWLDDYGVLKTLKPQEVYDEFTSNSGYIVAPKGAKFINIPMWNNSDANEVYILNREHNFKNGICEACDKLQLEIITQPQDSKVKLNDTYYVSVEAKGEGLKYQWYIRNEGSSKFSKSSVKTAEYTNKLTKARVNRELYCVITDAYGNKIQTDTVSLIRDMGEGITIVSQPQDSKVKLNDTYYVSVKAKSEGLKYQWYIRNEGNTKFSKSSVKTSEYTNKLTKARVNRELYCVITDAYGNKIQTDTVSLIRDMGEGITIISQPQNSTVKLKETYYVSVEAKGEGLKYQWYIRNEGSSKFSKSSVTTPEYTNVLTKARVNRELYCIITDAYGNKVTTETVSLIRDMGEGITIISQPQNSTVKLKETYYVSVEAKGEGLKYQWYIRNEGSSKFSKSSVTTPEYTNTLTKARVNRELYCIITDTYGNKVQTDTVKLIQNK